MLIKFKFALSLVLPTRIIRKQLCSGSKSPQYQKFETYSYFAMQKNGIFISAVFYTGRILPVPLVADANLFERLFSKASTYRGEAASTSAPNRASSANRATHSHPKIKIPQWVCNHFSSSTKLIVARISTPNFDIQWSPHRKTPYHYDFSKRKKPLNRRIHTPICSLNNK